VTVDGETLTRSCPSCSATVSTTDTWCRECFAIIVAPAKHVPSYIPPAIHPASVNTEPWERASVEPLAPSESFVAPPMARPRPAPIAGKQKTGIVLVLLCIAGGGLQQLLFSDYVGSSHDAVERKLRFALGATVTFYVVVAAVLMWSLQLTGRRLRWRGRLAPLPSIAIGAAVGLGLSGLAVAVQSSAGQPIGDSNVRILIGEGGFLRPALIVFTFVLAGPVIEEALFRGSLAEGLRQHGWSQRSVIWTSALLFAVWHWQPDHIRYFAFLGVGLAVLWTRGGLFASVAAHMCFNGLLTFAAIAGTLGTQTFTGAGVTVTAHSEWTQIQDIADNTLALNGPSGSALVVRRVPNPDGLTATQLLHSGQLDSLVHSGSNSRNEHLVTLPIGEGVQLDATAEGHDVAVVIVPEGSDLLVVGAVDFGSERAARELPTMIQSLSHG
jgi:membrane protease YdiL (CAAX protease family)